jgi:hypothetical protein
VGQTSASFAITANKVKINTIVTITVTANGVSKSAGTDRPSLGSGPYRADEGGLSQ